MKLQDILYKSNIRAIAGDVSIELNGLQLDSRKIQAGNCFIAIKGVTVDGHEFLDKAIAQGAIAIVCEKMPAQLHSHVTYVQVENSALALGHMSHLFYGTPTEKFTLVGVTGTNGKTTVATLLYQLFTALGHCCGLISTVKCVIGEKELPATHTTPDSVSLNQLLSEMASAGCSYVFMECSSHAIHQHRIAGLKFAGAIFTNISHDHLDYHQTFEEYIRVKKSWFDDLPSQAFALTNLDDKRGLVMLQNTKAKKVTYSLKTLSDFKGKVIENSLAGLHMLVNEMEVHFKMVGGFNAYNLLAVFGAAVCLDQDKMEVLRLLSTLKGAEGRFDVMVSGKEQVFGIVDYAHTPDALLNVLATIGQIKKGKEHVITVVGCGGDRDSAKRPLMAEVACEHSDKVIFTSDNPRSEDPENIIKEMEAGVNVVARKKYISIPDRREAIKTAVALSQKEDIILVAGKGHEHYQEVNGVRIEFDDKSVLAEMFELLDK